MQITMYKFKVTGDLSVIQKTCQLVFHIFSAGEDALPFDE